MQHGADLSVRNERILEDLRKSHIDLKKELATEQAKMARLRHVLFCEDLLMGNFSFLLLQSRCTFLEH